MMACSLAGLFASRSIRPVATTYCRFFSLKLEGKCTPEIHDLFKKANCPRLSATTNLARLLNLMDNRIGVTPAACPRWDVMEDTKALYFIRDMSGLPNKDIMERLELYQYNFGCINVWCAFADNMKFWVTLGRPGPRSTYPGYFIAISTPDTVYHPSKDIVMDVKEEVLKITIPKKKGKWIRNRITTKPEFYGPPASIISVENDDQMINS